MVKNLSSFWITENAVENDYQQTLPRYFSSFDKDQVANFHWHCRKERLRIRKLTEFKARWYRVKRKRGYSSTKTRNFTDVEWWGARTCPLPVSSSGFPPSFARTFSSRETSGYEAGPPTILTNVCKILRLCEAISSLVFNKSRNVVPVLCGKNSPKRERGNWRNGISFPNHLRDIAQMINYLSKKLVSCLNNSSSCRISLVREVFCCLCSHGRQFDVLENKIFRYEKYYIKLHFFQNGTALSYI